VITDWYQLCHIVVPPVLEDLDRLALSLHEC